MAEKKQWNTNMGRMFAERYTQAKTDRWHQKRVDRAREDFESGANSADEYVNRMNRLRSRLPEVHRIHRMPLEE